MNMVMILSNVNQLVNTSNISLYKMEDGVVVPMNGKMLPNMDQLKIVEN